MTATNDILLLSLQVLGIRQGELDLHGRPRQVTWTRLAETASGNASSITLQESVDWVPGDRIVIAPTGKDGNETEVSCIFERLCLPVQNYPIPIHLYTW